MIPKTSIKKWNKRGIDFEIMLINIDYGDNRIKSHHCGYCTFQHDRLLDDNERYLEIDVHGGITYQELSDDGQSITYGFDCAHWGDEDDPKCGDLDWLTGECESMAYQIACLLLTPRFLWLANKLPRLSPLLLWVHGVNVRHEQAMEKRFGADQRKCQEWQAQRQKE